MIGSKVRFLMSARPFDVVGCRAGLIGRPGLPMKLPMKLLAILLLLIPLASHPAAAGLPAAAPNVILILADDLGYETIGANGGTSYPTPVLDRLASGGARFTDCFAQPLCTPTRVQLMSGLSNVRNYLNFGEMVTYMDKLVGTVVAKLDECGLREKTLVIFVGDNGSGSSPSTTASSSTAAAGSSISPRTSARRARFRCPVSRARPLRPPGRFRPRSTGLKTPGRPNCLADGVIRSSLSPRGRSRQFQSIA
jgi:hypothetical protein